MQHGILCAHTHTQLDVMAAMKGVCVSLCGCDIIHFVCYYDARADMNIRALEIRAAEMRGKTNAVGHTQLRPGPR